ncbi:AGAP005326-PA-like protein [Anopheles sinensis]|uniref:AGAP005326-PA-like protein n=1 Tax=Anopheles sinensis TaxID=74873 RepID=A0A084VAU5_ANOSI|nr:AGAP005326-PA-like protein [Anopheles sinensis]
MNRSKYKPEYFRAFPLHHAAAKCYVVEVQRQLDADTNPYKPTEEGLTALHAAVANNSVAVVDVLLKRYADDLSIARETIQHRFLWKPELVEWKNRPILIAWSETECQAALALATSCPAGIPLNVQIFVLLRQPQEGHRFVALDVCNRSKRVETLRFIRDLLPNGVLSLDRSDLRVNVVNYLHMACSYSKKEIIAKLIRNGASLSVPSGEQQSFPYMAACEAFRKDIAIFLATNYLHHFDPGACDRQDYNALHKMLQRNQKAMAEEIVQHMLKYRMSKYRETMSQAITNIFRFDSKEYSYITVWTFASSVPMRDLCSKYVLQGEFDLRTKIESSSLLGIFITRGIALDYCLQKIEEDLDLLRLEGSHNRENVLHKLIRCKRLTFVKDLYEKHGPLMKEIFETEDPENKPAFELLRILVQNMDEYGLVFALENHRDYYVRHMDYLINATFKQSCLKKTAHIKLSEIMAKIIPEALVKLDEIKNTPDSQQNDFYDMMRDLRESFRITIPHLEATGQRLEDYLDGDGRTFLHTAVSWSEKDLVEKLLARNFDVMKKDANGCLPIHLARNESIFEMLLAKNESAQLECVNETGYNLLHVSCGNGLRGSALEKLLEHGMDVNEPTPDGNLPLSLASCCGTVRFLLNHGARVELLNEQFFCERLPKMQYCGLWELLPHIFQKDWFKSYAHLLLPSMVGRLNRDFFYCDHERHLERHEDIRRMLFDSLFEHSKEEASKLFWRVCQNAIVCCARWFLEYNYDLDYDYRCTDDWDRSTPLLGLLSYMELPNDDIVEKLLQKPIDVNATNDRKRNALIILADRYRWAKYYGHSLETFRLLLKRGAKLDEQDESGNTALHYAFQEEQWELVEFLIESGANTTVKNESNKLPGEMGPAFNRCLFSFIR